MEGPTSLFQSKSYPSFLVNRIPFNNEYSYKNFSEETDENTMVTDENANDVVDMAPHRWKKPAQRPVEPLTKNNLLEAKVALSKMNGEEDGELNIGEKFHPMDEATPPTKEAKKNVFINLFKSKQAKKPFFSRNKNKLE